MSSFLPSFLKEKVDKYVGTYVLDFFEEKIEVCKNNREIGDKNKWKIICQKNH